MRTFSIAFLIAAVSLPSCSRPPLHTGDNYVPLAEAERGYGAMISAANHPTPDQHGTGELVGIFRDRAGTLWGLPLAVTAGTQLVACAPPGLRDAKITGSIPAGGMVIAAANRPTGWRSGTGDLLLLVRDNNGAVHVEEVRSAPMPADSACRAAELPGPPQRLEYYRVTQEQGR